MAEVSDQLDLLLQLDAQRSGAQVAPAGSRLKTRCLLLPGHCAVLEELRIVLHESPDFVLQQPKNPTLLLSQIAKSRAHNFVLLDGDDPDIDVYALASAIRQRSPKTETILFSYMVNLMQVNTYLRAGLSGVISKDHAPGDIKHWLNLYRPLPGLSAPRYEKLLIQLLKAQGIF